MPDNQTTDDLDAAWIARRDAHLAAVGRAAGFDATPDHAVLIARYFEASRNRYHADHQDPTLGQS